DKAAMDLPAGFAGKVVAIKVKVGDKVADGDLLAEIEVSAGAAVVETNAPAQPAVEQSVQVISSVPEKPAQSPAAQIPPAVSSSASSAHASPAIRQFARELGADLGAVKGSGRKGRITREDVIAYVKSVLQSGVSSSAGGAGLQPLPSYDHSRWGEVESVKLSRIRQLTAKNLSRSWPQIPQVTQFDEADITELEAFRKAQKGLAEQRGTRLTLLALVMKAVATSLKNYPDFNSSLADDGEQLILKKYFHIGVAVDTPNGLVVPVVRDVNQKGIFDIAADLGELSSLARDRRLKPDQMQGSSFTISSLGGIGGTAFTPVVNHPNVAILGLSRSAMKPVWDGAEFQPRLMLPLSLSYDHRVVDGAVAARFARDLAENLQDLRRVLL
ncbi:MAG: 2-oxo acid dehydrogenase subunit E2, partial [Immundisolibacteraceae bacterium]|nr:2-oxo acid dehydrogenase subunit E2 [Immundisolibacteraceae bacterium]